MPLCTSNARFTYGNEDTMKQTIDSRPRITLAMSLASWAHSPSPSQTHSDPFGHRELKFPSLLSLNTPSDITAYVERTQISCNEAKWWRNYVNSQPVVTNKSQKQYFTHNTFSTLPVVWLFSCSDKTEALSPLFPKRRWKQTSHQNNEITVEPPDWMTGVERVQRWALWLDDVIRYISNKSGSMLTNIAVFSVFECCHLSNFKNHILKITWFQTKHLNNIWH